MEQGANGSNDPTRLDRIERIIEVLANTQVDLQQDVRIVLKAQVVQGEQISAIGQQLQDGFAKLTSRMDELAAAQKHTDERMDALILTVDEIVRGRKQS